MDRYVVETCRVVKRAPAHASPAVHLMTKSLIDSLIIEACREATGSFVWLTNTSRPDLPAGSQAWSTVTIAVAKPHSMAMLTILACTAATMYFGVTFRRGSGKNLPVFADSPVPSRGRKRKFNSLGGFYYGRTLFVCSITAGR